jgi:hypothetical protein
MIATARYQGHFGTPPNSRIALIPSLTVVRPSGRQKADYEKLQGICPRRALFSDFPGKPEKEPLMIFPASEASKVLCETNVTHVPVRELRPA